ncbi:unnamed protein product [Lampetra fluviatilis]
MAGYKRGHDGQMAGLYDLERTLGKGHFAVVKLARHVFTGERVAVKVIDKSKLDVEARAHLFQEVRCMKLVQHPNIVRLYEVIDTASKLYLILELAEGGDLYDYIMRHEGGLQEPDAKHYFAQILCAIAYCHRLHVVHRDLKPENVVFFPRLRRLKLTDFGFSNRFQPGTKLATSCGSLAYAAPEILLGDEYDAPAVDIWSLGVILYMLVCGHPPFQEANDSETLTMIMDCKYTVPAHVSRECTELIGQMLQREPRQRATLEEIGAHPWLGGTDPALATPAPLTSHRSLSEREHSSIVQGMVLGSIADRDTIVEALEADRYNHITATYYLLAERLLREKQEGGTQGAPRSGGPGSSKTQFRQSWPTKLDKVEDVEDLPSMRAVPPLPMPRAGSTKCKGPGHKGPESRRGEPRMPEKPARESKPPLSSLGEEDEEAAREERAAAGAAQVVFRQKASLTSRLTARKSAPVLNQIFEEEGESEDDDRDGAPEPPEKAAAAAAAAPSPSETPPHRPRKQRPPSQGRGSSCSSSETSDEDSESWRRRRRDDGGDAGLARTHGDRRDDRPPPGGGGRGGEGGGLQPSAPGPGGLTERDPAGAGSSRGGAAARPGGGGGGGTTRRGAPGDGAAPAPLDDEGQTAGGPTDGAEGKGGRVRGASPVPRGLSCANMPRGAAPLDVPLRAGEAHGGRAPGPVKVSELLDSFRLLNLCLSGPLAQSRRPLAPRPEGASGLVAKAVELLTWVRGLQHGAAGPAGAAGGSCSLLSGLDLAGSPRSLALATPVLCEAACPQGLPCPSDAQCAYSSGAVPYCHVI